MPVSKDVLIAGGIVVVCGILIVIAVAAPKKSSTEGSPSSDGGTTISETPLTPLPPSDPGTSFGSPLDSNPSTGGPSGMGGTTPPPGVPPFDGGGGIHTPPPVGGPGMTHTPPVGGSPFGQPPGLPPVGGPVGSPFGGPTTSGGPTFGNPPGGLPPIGNPGFNSGIGGMTPPPGPGGFSQPLPPVETTPPPVTEGKVHVVKSGEVLGDIAQQYLGSAKKWKDLVQANPGLDPKSLKVGQKINIPAKPDVAPTAPGVSPVVGGPGERTYTIQKGDTLYAIAKRELGNSRRWKEIESLNGGLSSADLKVGHTIKLPAGDVGGAVGGSPVAPGLGDAPANGPVHVVERGETLSDISRKHFGTPNRWKDIIKANPGVSPENLKVGQKLTLPAGATGSSAPDAGASNPLNGGSTGDYVVKSGDTPRTIAAKELGNANRAKEILDANPGLDPRRLRVGQTIKIPGKAGAPVSAPAPAPSPSPFGASPSPSPFGNNPAPSPFGAPTPSPAPFGGQPSPFSPPPAGNAGPDPFAPSGAGSNTSAPPFASPYGAQPFSQPADPFAPPAGGRGSPSASPFDSSPR